MSRRGMQMQKSGKGTPRGGNKDPKSPAKQVRRVQVKKSPAGGAISKKMNRAPVPVAQANRRRQYSAKGPFQVPTVGKNLSHLRARPQEFVQKRKPRNFKGKSQANRQESVVSKAASPATGSPKRQRRPRGNRKSQNLQPTSSAPKAMGVKKQIGKGRKQLKPVTVEDLDRLLEDYMGDDSKKQRLDNQLNMYFSNEGADVPFAADPVFCVE